MAQQSQCVKLWQKAGNFEPTCGIKLAMRHLFELATVNSVFKVFRKKLSKILARTQNIECERFESYCFVSGVFRKFLQIGGYVVEFDQIFLIGNWA